MEIYLKWLHILFLKVLEFNFGMNVLLQKVPLVVDHIEPLITFVFSVD